MNVKIGNKKLVIAGSASGIGRELAQNDFPIIASSSSRLEQLRDGFERNAFRPTLPPR